MAFEGGDICLPMTKEDGSIWGWCCSKEATTPIRRADKKYRRVGRPKKEQKLEQENGDEQ